MSDRREQFEQRQARVRHVANKMRGLIPCALPSLLADEMGEIADAVSRASRNPHRKGRSLEFVVRADSSGTHWVTLVQRWPVERVYPICCYAAARDPEMIWFDDERNVPVEEVQDLVLLLVEQAIRRARRAYGLYV